MIEKYYLSPEYLHIGCEKPAAYFIPFGKGQCPFEERENSQRFTLLNGEWDFKFYPNVREVDFTADTYPASEVCPDKMKVPFNWQLVLDKGYDVPNYINQDYPYPVDPPHLPDIIPAALYRRGFSYSKKDNKAYYLSFEGVSAGFYLWVNGEFTGYSQVSHAESKFNITDKLLDGENIIEALVIKHTDGSYLEDQDFFRLSGIFRDVYILERDEKHLKDIHILREFTEDFLNANITVKPDFSEKTEFLWTVFSPDGEEILSGTEDGEFTFDINNPVLWNAELPLRYSLVIASGDEVIRFPLALSKAEIKDRCFLFNGKKIKFYGINRHDSNPETGYAVTMEDMIKDLHILKGANVNMIRTSHYPNDPRFVDLCEEKGFMLVDEADFESHGMGYNYGDWYWDYWAHLADVPEWKEACLDRAERLFERDKNYACVVMWSLGNESGCGESHRRMANFIRSRDSKAIIHYENARLEYEGRVGGRDFKDISDVESRMYATLEYLEEYLNDEKHTKPFYYCEYVSCTSTGDIPLHWNDFEKYDNYTGGCIWEFCDHAVNIGTKENPQYRYGGDFGDYPHDKYYCIDGLVYPDRRPRPGFYDMKQTYIPVTASFENGELTVFNKRYFSDLSEYDLLVYLSKDGKVTEEINLGKGNIEARTEKKFALSFDTVGENVTLTLVLCLNKDTFYAQKGFKAGFIQLILADSAVKYTETEKSSLEIKEDKCNFYITAGNISYVFSKITGKVTSIKNKEKEYLTSPIEFTLWRQTFNHKEASERARYFHAYQKTYAVNMENGEDIKITADVSFASPAMPPALKGKAIYTFKRDGRIEVSFMGDVTHNAQPLPRFGLKLSLIKDFEAVEYYGYGPKESYSDRYKSQYLGRFTSTVTEQYENFINPCESSAHYKTKYASVRTSDGEGLEFYDTSDRGFSFKAIHFSDIQMENTAHHDELVPLDETIVNIDYKLHAENQELSYLEPERAFTEKHFEFSYIIKPI
ncbi:MAG: DUF4981 domain-containing protein [Clostridia bacterium]|nr:DUF4981 domain-containing protein [Clostridia bacterium]